jgi:hypothetical protein
LIVALGQIIAMCTEHDTHDTQTFDTHQSVKKYTSDYSTRQLYDKTHGKENVHGSVLEEHTAKKHTQQHSNTAVSWLVKVGVTRITCLSCWIFWDPTARSLSLSSLLSLSLSSLILFSYPLPFSLPLHVPYYRVCVALCLHTIDIVPCLESCLPCILATRQPLDFR